MITIDITAEEGRALQSALMTAIEATSDVLGDRNPIIEGWVHLNLKIGTATADAIRVAMNTERETDQ